LDEGQEQERGRFEDLDISLDFYTIEDEHVHDLSCARRIIVLSVGVTFDTVLSVGVTFDIVLSVGVTFNGHR